MGEGLGGLGQGGPGFTPVGGSPDTGGASEVSETPKGFGPVSASDLGSSGEVAGKLGSVNPSSGRNSLARVADSKQNPVLGLQTRDKKGPTIDEVIKHYCDDFKRAFDELAKIFTAIAKSFESLR